MEVKEAIKYLKLCKLEDTGSNGEDYMNIIKLLQELEKYKEMWKELRMMVNLNNDYGFEKVGIGVVKSWAKEIEQKHLEE